MSLNAHAQMTKSADGEPPGSRRAPPCPFSTSRRLPKSRFLRELSLRHARESPSGIDWVALCSKLREDLLPHAPPEFVVFDNEIGAPTIAFSSLPVPLAPTD